MSSWEAGELLDLERWPIDDNNTEAYRSLVSSCQRDLKSEGLFSLHGLMRPKAISAAISALAPTMETDSFTHAREHNIYFKDNLTDITPDHPALQRCHTVNHTLGGDQLANNPVTQIYEYPPLAGFLADVMGVSNLYLMEDHIARLNVMSYRDGEALNWHFDRSHFTTTLLLQNAAAGGHFQYRRGLRSDNDPNYDGVAKLLRGEDREVHTLELEPGTLNVFLGKNTAHRISTVEGDDERLIAVFSYYDRPGVLFSREERVGFYGRPA